MPGMVAKNMKRSYFIKCTTFKITLTLYQFTAPTGSHFELHVFAIVNLNLVILSSE